MRTDHAIVLRPNQQIGEVLDYLAKKANRLGIDGREIVRVYMEEDEEGKHVYYDTQKKIGAFSYVSQD